MAELVMQSNNLKTASRGQKQTPPKGAMTPSSPINPTSQESAASQPSTIRLMPKIINLSGLTGALNPIQANKENPSHIEPPFNPSGLSTLQWAKQKQVCGQMLDGYKSSGESSINLEDVMMVAFNQLEGSDQVNIMAQNQTDLNYQRQQKELEEQSAFIRESTARVLAAQEELITEALKAKDCLRA
jgi:hypothetical protein